MLGAEQIVQAKPGILIKQLYRSTFFGNLLSKLGLSGIERSKHNRQNNGANYGAHSRLPVKMNENMSGVKVNYSI
jgi:hypothetical protein